MHAGRHYSMREVTAWTRRETLVFIAVATLPTLLHTLAGWTWLVLPWLPIALVGTAVAFITGFKNSASYARLWEARQIWGSIINGSRAWGLMVKDFVGDERLRTELLLRHLAWLAALRFQLRAPRVWENMRRNFNEEYQRSAGYRVAEWDTKVEDELARYIDGDELAYVLAKKNRAAHLLALQGQTLVKAGLGEYRHVEMERALAAFYDAQGRCERIKNFPYPRQFATLNRIFVWMFIALVPLGLLQEFQKLGAAYTWVTIPASVLVAWVFHTMEKIGEGSENPFEGGPNDVPITALARTIEIDLCEMFDREAPPPLSAVNNILM